MFEVFYKQCGKYKVYSVRDDGGTSKPYFLIYINNSWEWVSGIFCTPVEVDINPRLTKEEYKKKYCKYCFNKCPFISRSCAHYEELEQ